MNFKFTKLKTIILTGVSAILGIYFFMQSMIFDGSPSLTEILISKFKGFMFGFIILFLPTYIIWSLFENKQNETSLNFLGIMIGILVLLVIILSFIVKLF